MAPPRSSFSARDCAVSEAGFPCGVSLVDAEVGAKPGVGEIPAMLQYPLQSVRAYDEAAVLVGADVAEGRELDATIRRLLSDRAVSYLHVRNARPGCYNCRVVRA